MESQVTTCEQYIFDTCKGWWDWLPAEATELVVATLLGLIIFGISFRTTTLVDCETAGVPNLIFNALDVDYLIKYHLVMSHV